MSFYRTAQEIRVEGWTLFAVVEQEDGRWDESAYDLNRCIGNDNGRFQWGGENFAETAEEIRFAIEGVDNVPVLRALLRDVDGELHEADVNLAEHITNRNGVLEYQEESLL
ncbi:Cyanovirin-N [Aspergillus sclerotioniger CBS 115572]|uniref:Cyanovirin-N n=1 Tax=Aspergillus sclerotioniger CBS 115572 TaxID=1450535 RepID=A0A317X8J5_9EURO|nr:Cyanovirin-N [Aspergillus sclerotioniger CBS 115572]PWY94924.1 Cyanovirin-N [Aspergillus sclerotioniger CBS 115572]